MESSANNNIPANQDQSKGDANPDGFTDLSLEMAEAPQVKQRVPRRILHFSDGVLEEYSTEEESDDEEPDAINPTSLSWFPWMKYQFGSVAFNALSAADVCGEKLAWLLGITSPKYQYAIDEHNRMQKEDEEEKERDDREREAERRRMGRCLSEVESALPANLTTTRKEAGVLNDGYTHEEKY